MKQVAQYLSGRGIRTKKGGVFLTRARVIEIGERRGTLLEVGVGLNRPSSTIATKAQQAAAPMGQAH